MCIPTPFPVAVAEELETEDSLVRSRTFPALLHRRPSTLMSWRLRLCSLMM